jgi:hypothetical protein
MAISKVKKGKESPKGNKIKAEQLLVSGHIKQSFQVYCAEQDITMKEALDIVLRFVTINKLNLNELDNLFDRNLTKEVFRYHNYTAGFLKEFEKNQIGFLQKLTKNLPVQNQDNDLIYKVFFQEMLVNIQAILPKILGASDAKILIDRNSANINKVLNDNET